MASDENLHSFTVTTDKYEVGDQFGFAVVKAGCTVEEEEACALDPTRCEHDELCDHRYDSGSSVDTWDEQDYTCGWSKNTLCSSKSPFANLTVDARTCLADPHGAWLNRVVPANHEGAISAVWGSCATEPGGDDDAGEAAAACHSAPADQCVALSTSPPLLPPPPTPPTPPPVADGDRPPSPAFYDMTHTVDGDSGNRATPLVLG